MNRIRLVYEQIEEAKRFLLSKSVLQLRLSLILLDNAAELMMYEALKSRFDYDDHVTAPIIRRSEELGVPLAYPLSIKYSPDERKAAERDFEGMLRLLDIRLGHISREDRSVLSVTHRIRRDSFHRGFLREDILQPVCNALFRTVVGLTLKLKPRSMSYSELSKEENEFLARFKIPCASLLLDDSARKHISGVLLEEVDEADPVRFAELLSQEVLSRIEQSLDGLKEIIRSGDEEELDMLLNHEDFWREKREELESLERMDRNGQKWVFRDWIAEGRSRFSIKRIAALQRKAILIATQKSPARALSLYWNVERMFEPCESRISKIVADFDAWVDLQVDIARGK